MKGNCKKADTCDFWHPKPCSFYKRNACSLGNKCVFMHYDANGKVVSAKKATEKPTSETEKEKAKPKVKAKAKAKKTPQANIAVEGQAITGIATVDLLNLDE